MANAKTAEVNFEEYTVVELKQMAKDAGVHVPSDATKDEIITALEDANVNPTSEDNPTTAAEQDAGISLLALTGPIIPLPLADVVIDAYGIGKKYNITLADIQGLGAVLQGNFLLDSLPAGSIVQITRVKHSQSVAGGGIATCTAQLGDGTNSWGAALDVFAAPSNAGLNTAQLTANNIGPFNTVYPVYLTFVATVGNLGGATSGAISAWLRYTPLA